MAICNRDLGPSQQVMQLTSSRSSIAGSTVAVETNVCQVSAPGTIQAISIAALSVANSPVVAFDLKRNTPGGVTTIQYMSSTMTVVAFGASAAYQSPTLAAAGSSLLQVQAGDVISMRLVAGATQSMSEVFISVGVQASQDIKSFFGIVYGN